MLFVAIALFQQECPKRARKFLAYVEKHRHRLVNYELLQAEHHISIGSGAVESAIKQIDRRDYPCSSKYQNR